MLLTAATLLTLGLSVNAFAQATGAEQACGAYRVYGATDGIPSDQGVVTNINVGSADLRSITIRSSKGTTRVQSVQAYEQNSRRWIQLASYFTFKLTEDMESTVCIPRKWSVSQIQIQTSGGDKAKYRWRLGHP
jgi:hypothetical protein